MYKSNGNANVKRRIETNNSCMDCSIEYFSETYLDGEDEDKNYVRLVNIWKTRSNGKETKRKVSKIFNYLEKNLNKEVSITYDSPSSGKRSRVVTPRELYFSTGREYLIALCKESNEEKSFRVDRISKTG